MTTKYVFMNTWNVFLRRTAFFLLLMMICCIGVPADEVATSFMTDDLIKVYACIHGCGLEGSTACLEQPVMIAVCEADAVFCELLEKEPPTEWDVWVDHAGKYFQSDPSLAHAAFVFAYATLLNQNNSTAFTDYNKYLAVLISMNGAYGNLSLSGISDLKNVAEDPSFQDIIEGGGTTIRSSLLYCTDPGIYTLIVEEAIQQRDIATLEQHIAYLEVMLDEFNLLNTLDPLPEEYGDLGDIQAIITEIETELAEMHKTIGEKGRSIKENRMEKQLAEINKTTIDVENEEKNRK